MLRPVVLLICTLLALSCEKKTKQPVPPPPTPKPRPRDPATVDIPLDEQTPQDPTTLPRAPLVLPALVFVRHILVKYHEAERVEQARWSLAEAERRASRLVEVARRAGADFLELARKYSEEPDDIRGNLHPVYPGEMALSFEDAAFRIGIGQVSDPVQTPFGFYVIRREQAEEYAAAHILIMYKGASLAGPGFRRTEAEARELAERVRKRALAGQRNFALLADRYSDSPSGKLRGGVLAPMSPATVPEGMENFFEVLRSLEVDHVSEVVQTPFGFHIIKRIPLERRLVQHILLAYEGSGVTPRQPRRKREAKKLIAALYEQALKPGTDFTVLTRQFSDDLAAPDGRLPPFARGQMTPRFEQFAFALERGQTSVPFTTKFGYHLVRRLR